MMHIPMNITFLYIISYPFLEWFGGGGLEPSLKVYRYCATAAMPWQIDLVILES